MCSVTQNKEFVQGIVERLAPLDVRARSMFGSYGLYCDEKFVGIISGDRLHLKRSDADPALFDATEMAPPFPGAKDWHRVPPELLADEEWLRDAVQATADGLRARKRRDASRLRAY